MSIVTFQPKDRTKREHIGQVSRVVWCDPDAPAVILKLTDGDSVIGPGDADQFISGQQFRFYGRWQEGKYGPEFRFQTFTRDTPHTKPAVLKYLSQTCENVGQATAAKLWDTFGPDAVRVLREEPGRVAEAKILSEEAAREASKNLEKFAHIERTKVDLFGLFAGRGFPGSLIERAIATWGVAAPDVIRRNPFSLLVNKLPGCGFKRTDKLYIEFGKSHAAIKRQAIAAWNAIREDRSGSTWVDANDIVSAVKSVIPAADPIKALKLLIRAGWVRVHRSGRDRFVTLRSRAEQEQRIADNVRRLLKAATPSTWPTELSVGDNTEALPSEHQSAEWKKATSRTVGLFVGGPGTGKTHTLAFGLKQVVFEHGPDSVAVAAPTGKAAVRAGESLRSRGANLRATTIHQLLEIGRNGHDGDGWRFQRNKNNPLDIRYLIIDESSMIDTSLMADLLDAIPDGACVLFVGDPYQLPPVGHGAPLRDLLAAGVPQGELTEVRRNAGAIVRACAAIKAGESVAIPDRLDLDGIDPANLKLVDCGPSDTVDVLSDVLDSITRFDRVQDVQIIVPLNDKSDTSRKKINERFGKVLNPDGRRIAGNLFAVGDKIICTRNTRLKCMRPIATRFGNPAMIEDSANYQEFAAHRGEVPESYVANGEIGRVIAIGPKTTIARFGGNDSPLVRIGATKKRAEGDEGNELEGGVADFDLAWAITVHRSQGSEWPLVIVLVDGAGSLIADRNFWYTAISRARTACLIIGPKPTFERQVKRQAIARRRTFLTQLLTTTEPQP